MKTMREYFVAISEAIPADHPQHDEYIDFIEKRIASLDAKSAKSAEKAGAKNADTDNIILNAMEVGKPYNISEMIKTIPSLADFSCQKVTSCFGRLVSAEKVKRTLEKGKVYFTRLVQVR